jgi:hypothetical protein
MRSTHAEPAESYTYDSWCRQSTATIGYGGTSGVFTTSYDPESTKVATVTYPDGLVATTSYGCAAVVNGATTCLNLNSGVAPGYVVESYITPYGSTTRLPLAQIYNEDARGQVTSRASADGMLTYNTYDPSTFRLTGITTGPCSGNCGTPTSVQNLT